MFKYQQFEDRKSDAIKPKALKRPYVDKYDNKERQGLDKYQNSSGRYIPLSSCLQKELNRLTDLSKRIKSLNHLICISKLSYQIITNFLLEFLDKEGLKA